MTTILTKLALRATFLAAALAAGAGFAFAQYPAKPVSLVIAAPPGAATDVVGRMLAEHLGSMLGRQFAADNRPGASGMLAASLVAKAAPDGHTLLFAPNSLLVAPHVLAKGAAGDLDVIRDLAPVVLAASSPVVILVHPSLGVKTIQEFVGLARRTDGIAYASSGTGSLLHLAGELFQRATGVKLTHVPYKGLAQAAPDVATGRVQTMFGVPGGAISGLISGGRVVPLAVTQKQRSLLLPNVPTLIESGIDGVEFAADFIMYAPAGTPPPILARLNEESTAFLRSSEVRERMAAIGVDARGSTLEEIRQKVREDYQRYGRIVSEFGIKE